MHPGYWPGWHRTCCSACRFDSSPISAGGRPSTQPLVEERDDPLACLIGRVAVDLADLVGQHRVRQPGKSVLIAWARIDFDHLECIAQPVLERLEPFAGYGFVPGEAQSDRAQSLVGG